MNRFFIDITILNKRLVQFMFS